MAKEEKNKKPIKRFKKKVVRIYRDETLEVIKQADEETRNKRSLGEFQSDISGYCLE